MPLHDDYSSYESEFEEELPRETGIKRILEVLSRDYNPLMLAGLINVITFLPFLFMCGYAVALHSILFALLAGVIGGLIAAPFFYGLADVILRGLRDEPAYGIHRYMRALRNNWVSTLLPGAVFGMVFALPIFIILHLPQLGGLGLLICEAVSVAVCLGIFLWALPQTVLLQLSFGALIKNSILLCFRYFGKSFVCIVLFAAYTALLIRLFPASVFLLLVCGFWLVLLVIFQMIYPILDEVFQIEQTLKENRKKASAQGE